MISLSDLKMKGSMVNYHWLLIASPESLQLVTLASQQEMKPVIKSSPHMKRPSTAEVYFPGDMNCKTTKLCSFFLFHI